MFSVAGYMPQQGLENLNNKCSNHAKSFTYKIIFDAVLPKSNHVKKSEQTKRRRGGGKRAHEF